MTPPPDVHRELRHLDNDVQSICELLWRICTVVARAMAALLVGVVCLAVDAAPASAHGGNTDATNFRSVVRGIRDDRGTPVDAVGVTWRVVGGDALLAVRNDGDRTIVVSGYDGEPYLRLGPDGAFENRNAPTTYRNADRFDRAAVPAHASVHAAPEWVQVSTEPDYGWHDHRVHWMAPWPPPGVNGATAPVHVFDWEVPFAVDGRQLYATGTLEWVPPPSWWMWLGAALATVVAPVVVVAMAGSGARRHRRVERMSAAVVVLVVAVAAAHIVDSALAAPVSRVDAAWAVLRGLACLMVAAAAARLAWRGGDHPASALVMGSVIVALTVGAIDFDVLTAALVPSHGPAWLARIAVALCVTLPAAALVAVGNRQRLRRSATAIGTGQAEGE